MAAEDGGKSAEASAAAAEKTFMTSVQQPEAMGRVKDLHGKIGSVVSHLNEKIALVLQKQEKEFLAAYRAHMLSVQKELQQLRAKANEAELAMKKNEKIRSLEDERNWYRKEALRLDKFATAMKKDLKYMKEKLESIEDDRKWLERQLKSSKKSNKLLRAELEIRMMQGEGGAGGEDGEFGVTGSGSLPGGGGDGSFGGAGMGGGSGMLPGGDDGRAGGSGDREPMFPMVRTSSAGNGAATGGMGGAGAGMGSSMGGGAPTSPGMRRSRGGSRKRLGASMRSTTELRAGSYSLDDDLTPGQFRALVERLEAQLSAEKRLVKQLRAHAVATSSQRSDLEAFFIKCIADVKKDVSRRRTKATQRSSKARPGAATRPPAGSTASSGRFNRTDPAAARAASPGLDDFTATDRRKVIRRLLSDDYVLQMLHQMIFGPADDTDLTAGPPENAAAAFTGPTGDMGGAPSGAGAPDTRADGMPLDPAVEDYLFGAADN